MQAHAEDEGVFIRSMATRGHLGGLARDDRDAVLVLDAAGKDVVIIETVGVGQDEVDIVRTADVSIVTLVPGAGDDVQALKAGIMEIADIFVVNKADREGADRLVSAIEANLALKDYGADEWRPPILKTVATSGQGVAELVDEVERFKAWSAQARTDRRRTRSEHRLRELVSGAFMDRLERVVLKPGELTSLVDLIALRQIDPYTAAHSLLERAIKTMKAILDHIGIAVGDLSAALTFYRDALGLEIEAAEDVPSQRVRAHFIPVGESSLELLEATATDSPVAKYLAKRGPGLHHITLRVEDIGAALAALKAKGVTLVDEHARPGAEGALVAFIHPSSAQGVLVELKQSAVASQQAGAGRQHTAVTRYTVGDLELISLSDGLLRLDGGLMFGMVPKTLWKRGSPSDDRNRVALAMRPLVVRGMRTMIIDAGLGDKEDAKFRDVYGVERTWSLDQSLAEAGLASEDIDIVLATHLHFDHSGGFTYRDRSARIRPRFPRARYVVRRGEWEDATHPNERNHASYRSENFVPLADAGVLDLVDDDQTIMPGVRVRRTGGHTMHHQAIWMESNGYAAAYPADIMPTVAHLPATWIMGIDAVSDGDARSEARVSQGSRRTPGARVLRARSRRYPRLTSSAAATAHVTSNHRHHRRQRPVRHGGTDRPSRSSTSPRRLAIRLVRMWSARCANAVSRSSPGTASDIACCRRS